MIIISYILDQSALSCNLSRNKNELIYSRRNEFYFNSYSVCQNLQETKFWDTQYFLSLFHAHVNLCKIMLSYLLLLGFPLISRSLVRVFVTTLKRLFPLSTNLQLVFIYSQKVVFFITTLRYKPRPQGRYQ